MPSKDAAGEDAIDARRAVRESLVQLREEFKALVQQGSSIVAGEQKHDGGLSELRREVERLCHMVECLRARSESPVTGATCLSAPGPPYPPFPPYPPYAPFPPFLPYPPNCCCAPAPCGCPKCSSPPPAEPESVPAPPPAVNPPSPSTQSSSSLSSWRRVVIFTPPSSSSSSSVPRVIIN